MTRWNKRKYIVTFEDGTTFERELTDNQFAEHKRIASRINAKIELYGASP